MNGATAAGDPAPGASAESSVVQTRCVDKLARGLELLFFISGVLVVVGLVLFKVLPPDPAAVHPGLFARPELRPEPTERIMFVVCATLGGCLCLCLPLVRWPRAPLSNAHRAVVAIISTSVLAFETWSFYALGTAATLFDLRLLNVAVAFGLALLAIVVTFNRAQMSRRCRSAVGVALSVVVAAIAIPQRVVLPAAISDNVAHGWHLEAVLYSVIQANAGAKCLIDYAPHYGCYAEWLKPWMLAFGQGLGSVTFAFGALHALVWIVVIATLLAALRSAVVSLSTVLTITIFYATSAFAGAKLDPYIQYAPVRTLFPALSVGVVWWWTEHKSRWTTAAISMAFGLGVIWNLDSSLPTIIAWLGLVAVDGLGTATGSARIRRAAWQLGWAVGGLGVTLLGVLVWLVARGGHPRHILGLFTHSLLVVREGYFQIAMPGLWHPWVVVALVYAAGMIAGGARVAGWLDDRRDQLALYASMLGLGLFSYFQGRSSFGNLLSAMWPAFVVYGLLADRIAGGLDSRSIRGRALVSVVAWPVALCGVLALGTAILRIPDVVGMWKTRLSQVSAGAESDFSKQAAFVRDAAGGKPALIVSIHQAALHAETGVPLHAFGPGIAEMVLVSDHERIKEQIALGAVPNVFLGQHLSFVASPKLLLPSNEVLGQQYVRVAVDPSQTLMHLSRR